MLLSFFRCQLRHIHHSSINIATSVLGGQWWHGIWWIIWSPTRYWRSLWLWRCGIWRARWLLTNRSQMRWINDWIIQWRRHRYHQKWQIIALWVTVLAIKALVITSVATTNTAISVCVGVVCMLFCLFMANKRWESIVLRKNCSYLWVSVPGKELITSFLSQYNQN